MKREVKFNRENGRRCHGREWNFSASHAFRTYGFWFEPDGYSSLAGFRVFFGVR